MHITLVWIFHVVHNFLHGAAHMPKIIKLNQTGYCPMVLVLVSYVNMAFVLDSHVEVACGLLSHVNFGRDILY